MGWKRAEARRREMRRDETSEGRRKEGKKDGKGKDSNVGAWRLSVDWALGGLKGLP